jgi:hypothetical protein
MLTTAAPTFSTKSAKLSGTPRALNTLVCRRKIIIKKIKFKVNLRVLTKYSTGETCVDLALEA